MLDNGEEYKLIQGDCILEMAKMPKFADVCIFSPPFASLFAYSSLPEDMGNSDDLRHESKIHFSYFFKSLIKVMKPGRIVVVHVMQIPGLARNNEKGTFDFRGFIIRIAKRAGFIYQYDWLVLKNAQSQAIRTHSHKLLFVSLERDRAVSCGAMGDYLIKFITPGSNEVPIDSEEISRNQWIEWAAAAWDVNEQKTLNVRGTKGEDDTKHICPLQLETIERLVKLYSNPGECLFTPFLGIGSEAYMALKLGRRAVGCEIKDEYIQAAHRNCERAIREREADKQGNLFPEEVTA